MATKTKLLILSSLIFAFLIITFFVINKNIFVFNLDNAINNFMIGHQSSSISNLMFSITKIGNFYEASAIFIIFGLFLILKNPPDQMAIRASKKYFCIFTIAIFLGAILPWTIKLLTQIQRPSQLLAQDFSFPSGHATVVTIFLLSSIFLITPSMKKGFSKNTFILITSIIFPLVAFSRIYLSVHWTSDVIAGIILGTICFLFGQIMCCHKKENVL